MATIAQLPSGAELLAKRVDGGHQARLTECPGSQLPHQRAQLGQGVVEQGSDLVETAGGPWFFLGCEIDQDAGQHKLLDGGVVERVGKPASLALDRLLHLGMVLADQRFWNGGHCSRSLADDAIFPRRPRSVSA